MKQLGRGRGRRTCQVVHLAQVNRQPPARRITSNANAIDAATNDAKVVCFYVGDAIPLVPFFSFVFLNFRICQYGAGMIVELFQDWTSHRVSRKALTRMVFCKQMQ